MESPQTPLVVASPMYATHVRLSARQRAIEENVRNERKLATTLVRHIHKQGRIDLLSWGLG